MPLLKSVNGALIRELNCSMRRSTEGCASDKEESTLASSRTTRPGIEVRSDPAEFRAYI